MRVIAVMNQKGGVGKTTTSVNLGAALAEAGKRVCMIDLDPQAHLTINYGMDPSPDQVALYDILIEDKSFLEGVHQIAGNIAIVPSSIDLAGAEVELVGMIGREQILKEKLDAAQHDFDYIIMDCPPSLGLLTINALAAAHEVIIPMQPQFLPLQGVAKLLETVQLVNKRVNPTLKVAGVVLTMFDSQAKLSNEVVAELQNFIKEAEGKPLPWAGAQIYKTKIRRNIKLAECPSFGQTIFQYDKESNGAADYRALAREVMGLGSVVTAPVVAEATTPVVATKPVVKNEAKAEAKPAAVKVAPVVAKSALAPILPKPPALIPKSTAPAAARPQRIAPAAIVNKPVTPPAMTPKPAVQVVTNPAVVQKVAPKAAAKPVEPKQAENKGAEIAAG